MNVHCKKLSSLLVAFLLTVPPAVSMAAESTVTIADIHASPVTANKVFRDVGNHWAANAIYSMTQYGIISGYDENIFKPGNSITREELSALLARSFSLEWADMPEVTSYQDVQPDRWSASYIEAVKGIFPDPSIKEASAEFLPAAAVTREEFAVALVKVMGYSPQKLQNPDILSTSFRDVDKITEAYRNDIALAVELKLVQGQSGNMFAPQALISRAEVASLLYRAIQLSVQEEADLLKIVTLSIPEQTANGTFEISGSAPSGTIVVINGLAAKMEADGSFRMPLRMGQEGTYNIVAAVTVPQQRVRFIRKKITYQLADPQISVFGLSSVVTKNNVELTGKVSDPASELLPVFYIGDEEVSLNKYGEFYKKMDLEEGNNTFVLKAVTNKGRFATVTKVVKFSPPAPVLTISDIAKTTKSSTITVSGTVKDINDEDVEVYLNGEYLDVDDNLGTFSKTFTLSNGPNTITVSAQNKYSKISTVVKTIELTFD
ncbi:S-layer homology domain-containing protein [Paenibacillus sp. YN15]|uniref:S-layer homology domain-containing protein n=1 Tax=Paenibacillus sp. YN15 TaxID=1742774 RepID=UPI0015EBA2B1|nr:S-layer homology domain-containing protein [Paenibacillus sp. YN15]